MGYPRSMRSRNFKFIRRTAGNLTANGTAWANLSTTLDLTLEAQVGDVIEAGLNGFWSNEATQGLLDVVTVVSGTPVNAFGQGGAESNSNDGAVGWLGSSGVNTVLTGSIMYALAVSDTTSGQVTLRLRVRTAAATNKVILATAADPLQFWVKNLGPQDPH